MSKKFLDKCIPIGALAILGVCIVYGIKIYRKTFIDWYLLFIPVIMGPVLIYFLLRLFFTKSQESRAGEKLITFIFAAPACYFVFLALNFYCTDTNCLTKTFKINGKGKMAARRNASFSSYIKIDFNQLDKQLVFSQEEYSEIETASNIKIEY